MVFCALAHCQVNDLDSWLHKIFQEEEGKKDFIMREFLAKLNTSHLSQASIKRVK